MDPERWKEIERLCQSALEMEREKREAYLKEACLGDESLRTEVEALLARQTEAEGFLKDPAIEDAARALARSQEVRTETHLAGRTLLQYHILEKIGEGGMGVVYRAHDTHLNRSVAIKLLPSDRIADAERKKRFVHEARAASALNHPNIITIHDISSVDEIDFIAMEYVAGKTLDKLIPRKGMRLSEVLKYSVQIADALAAAHAAGIVHRDLKPANVMVTEKGLVKVLDFGLAKLTQPMQSDVSGTAPSMESMTGEGRIIGTVAYMSPEQAEGKAVDARSDIFSFGSVLYEMLTGKKAFQANSTISTLSAILNQEAAPLGADIPHDLERIVTRCLRKDPARRFQAMSDLKVELEELKEEAESGRLQVVPSVATRVSPIRLAVVAFTVIALIVAGWYWLGRHRSAEPEGVLTAIPATSYPGDETFPSFSSDGSQIAFAWRREGSDNNDIYVKVVSSGEPLQLTSGPEEDIAPAWSPDGKQIAFYRRSGDGAAVYTVSPFGGSVRLLTQLGGGWPSPSGGYALAQLSWSADGELLAFQDQNSPREPCIIGLLSAATGEKRRLTSPPAEWLGDGSVAFSPDGQTVAFVRVQAPGRADLYLVLAGGGEPSRLTFDDRDISGLAWTADSREIVFSSRDNLWRVFKSGGNPQPVAGIGGGYSPAIPRQGRRLVFERKASDINIWRMEAPAPGVAPRPPTKLQASTRGDYAPQFSPDGRRVAFTSDRSGTMQVWVCDSDGSNPVQLTSLGEPGGAELSSWSPDGGQIAFNSRVKGNWDIYVISSRGGAPRQLTAENSEDSHPSWSRDGRWIYFTSNRTGTRQVWKVLVEGGAPIQVTKNGGDRAAESPEGQFVYFTKLGNAFDVWKVPVGGGEEVQVLKNLPRHWAMAEKGLYFVGRARGTAPGGKWLIQFFDFITKQVTPVVALEKEPYGEPLAVSPDGQTFLYTQADTSETDLMLVENFR